MVPSTGDRPAPDAGEAAGGTAAGTFASVQPSTTTTVGYPMSGPGGVRSALGTRRAACAAPATKVRAGAAMAGSTAMGGSAVAITGRPGQAVGAGPPGGGAVPPVVAVLSPSAT